MIDGHYEDVWLMPFRSQEFMEGPQAQHAFGELRLRLDHEGETGEYSWTVVVFRGIHALSFTGYASCTRAQVRAYDRLVQVRASQWLSDMKGGSPELGHYRIYFDDVGCYDIAATGFSIREEV